jgi:ABC-type uncharacterized transport system substrate-binding protein
MMENSSERLHVFLLFVVLCCVLMNPVSPLAKELFRIFIVHSYAPESMISQPQDKGIVQGLAKAGFTDGKNIVINRFYMDTKRTYTQPEQIKARGKEALERVRDFHPDLVITVDDNATKTVMPPLVDSSIPVVFSGINMMPEMYNHSRRFMENRENPGHNVTGVYENLYIDKSIQLMEEIIPDLRKVVFIVDDSPTGMAIKQQMDAELFIYGSNVLYSIRQISTFAEYKEIIRHINAESDIGAYYPMAVRLRTTSGRFATGREIFQWTLNHAHKPAFVGNTVMCSQGALGGVMVDFAGMGEQAAAKAVQILLGESAGDIPIEDAKDYALAFNIARAKQLGIVIPSDFLAAASSLYDFMESEISPEPFHLLIVQSQPRGGGDGEDVENGFLSELANNDFFEGSEIQVSRTYFDTNGNRATFETLHRQGKLIIQKIYDQDPDLIITLGDIATREVMLPLVDTPYPVLFGATHLPPEWYNRQKHFMQNRSFPAHNVSGITCELEYGKSLGGVRAVIPEVKRIVLIAPAAFPWQNNLKLLFHQGVEEGHSSCDVQEVLFEYVKTVNDLKEMVIRFNKDPAMDVVTVIDPAGFIRESGSKGSSAETVEWLVTHLLKPDFTFSDKWVRSGYLLAAAINVEATGVQMGRQILAIMRGADPGDLPIQRPSDSYLAINLGRAKRLGLEIPVDMLEAAAKVYVTMRQDIAH